jgi:histone-lysine N-methyltransferase SETMAR
MILIDRPSRHAAQMTQNFFTCNGLRKLDHPPYSPDIASSDFSLFVKVKKDLIGRSIQDEEDIFHEAMENVNAISTTESQKVFRNWMRRLE